MKPVAIVGVLLVVAATILRTSAGPEKTTPSITLTVRYGDPDESTTLADLSVLVEPGEPFLSISGGEMSSRFGEGRLEYGTRMKGRIDPQGDDQYVVAFDLKCGSLIHREEDPANAQAEIVRTESVEIRTTMKIGEKRSFSCSGLKRCDLRLER